MSVVAALSEWLVHLDRRHNGCWIQRYENGVPVTDLLPIADDGTRGTTVHFLADEALRTAGHVSPRHLLQLTARWRQLAIGSTMTFGTSMTWPAGDPRRTN
jgi:DNA gyrase subunit B